MPEFYYTNYHSTCRPVTLTPVRVLKNEKESFSVMGLEVPTLPPQNRASLSEQIY